MNQAATPAEPIEVRLARGLFYIGMLTLGESAFRVPPGLTPAEIAFILAFALCALASLRGAPMARIPVPILVAVAIFAFGGVISSLGSQAPAQSIKQVLHAIYVLLLWPWVGVMVIRSRQQLMTAFGLWSVSGAIDGVGAIAQLVRVHLPGTVIVGGRYAGFTTQQNDLGGVAGVGLVPALVFAARGERPAAPFRLLLVALVVAGLVLSGSVAGMVGALLATLIWLLFSTARSSSLVAVAVAVLSAVAIVVLAGSRLTPPTQRVTQVTSAQGGSADIRLTVARAAWRTIKQNPVVGRGMDTADSTVVIFSDGQGALYQVHILPVAAWYEAGIFGFIGMVGLLCYLALLGWRTMRRSWSPDERAISWALLGTFAAFVVEVMAGPMVFQEYAWVAAVMLVAWSAAFSRQRDHRPRVTGALRSKLSRPV